MSDAARVSLGRRIVRSWTWAVPVAAIVLLVLVWERELSWPIYLLAGAVLIGAVLAAVHHAEIVAHRVGEPFGSLVLAVAVTVIEVALIVTLMLGKPGQTDTLARDTVFAAVMITVNGIVGLSILIGSMRHSLPRFNREGAGAALAVVATLTTLTLVLPSFTVSEPGARFSDLQLAFVAIVSIVLYGVFVSSQTVRHRDFFLPVGRTGEPISEEEHVDPPTNRAALISLGLLLVALVGVVGLAKSVSPAIEGVVEAIGVPHSFVGVVVALVVLLPEGMAAVKAALRNRLQTSLNLGLGSAMASIGLTIPTLAVASFWLPGNLTLGLGPLQIVLFMLSMVVAILTLVPGRATRLQGMVHLAIFASFVFLAAQP
ncbi:MAG: ionic transporter y4hA [Micrococcales bacterium 73-13]|nr:MAG: ionic transporter y4hA [Micrococcales bacterium 73-13]